MWTTYKFNNKELVSEEELRIHIKKYKEFWYDEDFIIIFNNVESLIKKISIQQLKKYLVERTQENLDMNYSNWTIWLIKALKKFDLNIKNIKFSSFCYLYIKYEIQLWIAKNLWIYRKKLEYISKNNRNELKDFDKDIKYSEINNINKVEFNNNQNNLESNNLITLQDLINIKKERKLDIKDNDMEFIINILVKWNKVEEKDKKKLKRIIKMLYKGL